MMPPSAEGYYLAAYCINATSRSRAEVEWIVVSKSLSDEWVDRDGNTIHAFYTIPIAEPTPAIPAGWIEYLHIQAIKFATSHTEPKVDLITALGLKPKSVPAPKLERRI